MRHNMHIDQQIEIILWLQLKWQNLFMVNNIHAENDTEEIVDCSHLDINRKWRHCGRSKLTTHTAKFSGNYRDEGPVFICDSNSEAKAKAQSREEEEKDSQKQNVRAVSASKI